MIDRLSVMLKLLSLPDIQFDRREHISPRSSYTENTCSMFNENTSLVLNEYNIYYNFISFCIGDALKTKYDTYCLCTHTFRVPVVNIVLITANPS